MKGGTCSMWDHFRTVRHLEKGEHALMNFRLMQCFSTEQRHNSDETLCLFCYRSLVRKWWRTFNNTESQDSFFFYLPFNILDFIIFTWTERKIQIFNENFFSFFIKWVCDKVYNFCRKQNIIQDNSVCIFKLIDKKKARNQIDIKIKFFMAIYINWVVVYKKKWKTPLG